MITVWESLVWGYKAIAVFPFIPFLIVYAIVVLRGGERRTAVRTAMDCTTFFLVGIVAILLNNRSGSGFGFYLIALVMLIGAGLIGNAQNRLRGKIRPDKIFRAVWRLSFFAMSFLYIILMSLELILPTSSRT